MKKTVSLLVLLCTLGCTNNWSPENTNKKESINSHELSAFDLKKFLYTQIKNKNKEENEAPTTKKTKEPEDKDQPTFNSKDWEQTSDTSPTSQLGKKTIYLVNSIFHSNGKNSNNSITIGQVKLNPDGTGEYSYSPMKPSSNDRPRDTNYLHPPMENPGACKSWPIKHPRFLRQTSGSISWKKTSGNRVEIQYSSNIQETWTIDDQYTTLSSVRPKTVRSYGVGVFTQSPRSKGNLKHHQFKSRYSGYVVHKQSGLSLTDKWSIKNSSFSPSYFKTYPSTTNQIRGFTVKKSGPDVQHTMLLNYLSNKSLVIHEFGHDFDQNRCFDEYGHTSVHWAIVEKDKIEKIVSIEYSYQDRDVLNGKIPMLTVAVYY